MSNIKIAVISDIHGNLVALNAALKSLETECIDYYLIAGDNITDFPFSNEVINVLNKLTPYVIKGNREEYILEYLNSKEAEKWKTNQQAPIKYIGDNLNFESIKYIKKLNSNLSINLNGLKIKLVHGSITGISDSIYLNCKDKINDVSNNLEEDILIFGHTHEPACYKVVNGKVLINAGTIGVSYRKHGAEYVVINYDNNKIKVEVKNIKYNLSELKEKVNKTDILKICPTWVNLSYSTLLNSRDINLDFIIEAKQMMENKNKSIISKDAKGVYKNFNVIDDDVWDYLSKKYSKYFKL